MDHARMTALITAFPEAAVVVDRNLRIIAANPAATELAGGLRTGDTLLSRWRHPGILDAVSDALAGRAAPPRQVAIAGAGQETVLDVAATPVPPDAAVLVLADRSAAAAAERIRSDFVANASHELKSPLTALLGAIETLRGPAADDPAGRRRFLDMMEREAGRMAQLIDDLMSLNRVEAQERLRPRATVDLAGIARSAVAELAPLAEERGATVDLDAKEARMVQGDAAQLSQAVRNLLDNALRHAGSKARIEVSVGTRPADAFGRSVTLSVADDGPGIDPAHVPRLTERFYRVDGHRSRALGGTGLGLAIVKHIVGRHRGRFEIETAPGQGARFTIWLPAADRDEVS